MVGNTAVSSGDHLQMKYENKREKAVIIAASNVTIAGAMERFW